MIPNKELYQNKSLLLSVVSFLRFLKIPVRTAVNESKKIYMVEGTCSVCGVKDLSDKENSEECPFCSLNF